MKNKEQFKRLLKFVAAFVIIAIFAFSFNLLWLHRYNQAMKERFYYYGNVLMLVMYVAVYVISANSFSAFRIGYYKVTSLFGSQTLGILMTNFLTFVEISLISHGRLSPKPMIRLTCSLRP